ncbi:hypothetical protein AXG93_4537s1020 [Marchantia polymorpha subsp. ruderalis]|uniref:EF-hand domain-containing protein n=1 Tax=Marchantia polymorpha subsp. ruderalis TaxID=1480154 RepID=A0A176VQ68_MARPO|nr:hypothetical protein AXG93_4537s1020 [Marchantia polymorpha subsp. ruderalis]
MIEGPNSRCGVWGVHAGGRGRCRGASVCCHAQPQQQQSPDGGETVGEVEGVVDGMRKLLASEEIDLATQAARDLVSSLDRQGRVALLSAFYSCGSDEHSDAHFKEADVNLDGMLDAKEFATYAEAQAMKYGHSTKPLSTKQMVQLFTRAAIGMVGFGFTDNAIMIIAGDAIQNSIGATLGLTTLLSAGLGNAVADLIGTAFRGYIERWSGKMMPDAVPISAHQMEQKEAWWAETVGASSGVTVGCLLGLAPLFLLNHNNNSRKNEDRPIDSGANIDAKFASISSSTTSSFLIPQVDAAQPVTIFFMLVLRPGSHFRVKPLGSVVLKQTSVGCTPIRMFRGKLHVGQTHAVPEPGNVQCEIPPSHEDQTLKEYSGPQGFARSSKAMVDCLIDEVDA